MRAIATLVVAAALVAGAFSAACTMAPNGHLYNNAQGCSAYTTCGANFCGCVGSPLTAPDTCLSRAPNGTSCGKIQQCLAQYAMCIEQVPMGATGCSALNTSLKVSFMTAAATGYMNSTLQRSCQNRVCAIMNGTAQMCNFGVNESNVCMFHPPATTAAPAPATNMTNASLTTTVAPTQTPPPNFVAAVTALLTLAGSDFAKLRDNATAWAELRVSLSGDIARLCGLAPEFVHIVRMYIASLHVEFQVSAAAGVAPAVLKQLIEAGNNNTAWLASTKVLYATVSNETLTVSTSVTATAAPGVVTPAPTTAIDASAGVFTALAAVCAAVLAVFAL